MTNLIIERTEIRRDEAGRYAIADLHAAAGGAVHHRPETFLASDAFRTLQRELSREAKQIPAVVGSGKDLMVIAEVAYAFAAWISGRFALQLIRAYDRDMQAGGRPLAKLAEIEPEFAAACRMAESFGMRGNQALLSANRAVRLATGVDPAALLGVQGLVVEDGQRHFTVSQLGTRMSLSGRKFNQLLEEHGLQERRNGEWYATQEGAEFAVLVDVGKQHSDGTPVQQLRWLESVLHRVNPTPLLASLPARSTAAAPARYRQ